jgi:hypothetical protein
VTIHTNRVFRFAVVDFLSQCSLLQRIEFCFVYDANFFGKCLPRVLKSVN